MKLISLNTWGGPLKNELRTFLEKYKDVDIFCFQEVHLHASESYTFNPAPDPFLFDTISKALPDHVGYFRPHLEDWFGVAIFIKKESLVTQEEEHYIYKEKGYLPEDIRMNARLVQAVQTQRESKALTVFTLHGVWQPEGKGDTPDRVKQSERILEFTETFAGPKIISGDFNSNPDTHAITMFEEYGYRNLIKEFGVTSTRSAVYTKLGKYADYVFVSPDVKVLDFKVLDDEVSDHKAMMLEFEI